MCSGATSFVDYYRDYFLKTLSLEQSGAVMVIPVEAWIAKLPEHMDRGELTVLHPITPHHPCTLYTGSSVHWSIFYP
jgi:hypothetical protein